MIILHSPNVLIDQSVVENGRGGRKVSTFDSHVARLLPLGRRVPERLVRRRRHLVARHLVF